MATGPKLAKKARGFWDDFKDFINRGNLVDLALAVVLGGAFGAIVSSFIDDILMPALINPFLAETGGSWDGTGRRPWHRRRQFSQHPH